MEISSRQVCGFFCHRCENGGGVNRSRLRFLLGDELWMTIGLNFSARFQMHSCYCYGLKYLNMVWGMASIYLIEV